MFIEGRLAIDLYPAANEAERVRIRSSRPLTAARVFEGKTPHLVLQQLPLLFSVCGVAQATAAVQAIQQASALPPDPQVQSARHLLLHMETAREHLWRILVDWPRLLGETGDAAQIAPLQSLLPALRKALFPDGDAFSVEALLRVERSELVEQFDRLDTLLAVSVYGCAPADWLATQSADGLYDWYQREESIAARLIREVSELGWQGVGAADCGFLPDLPTGSLDRRLIAPDADRFVAEPRWENASYETTPLARQRSQQLIKALQRQHGNGLLTRLAARLVELARVPETLRQLAIQLESELPEPDDDTLPAGTGIGQVEAARGRLVHRVELTNSHVRRYQILAPTEWNFHPSGVVARALGSLQEPNEALLRRQANLLINAVDPCVSYDLGVH